VGRGLPPTVLRNAIALQPKQTQFFCDGEGGCRLLTEVEWPADADRISEVLQEAAGTGDTELGSCSGHRQAIACNVAEGQTVADLIAENNEYGRL
jgi:hypothetical protein